MKIDRVDLNLTDRFEVIAGSDISQGLSVKISQGKRENMVIQNRFPLKKMKEFENQGATGICIVDMDRNWGTGNNLELIKQITRSVQIPVFAAGGIRTLESVQEVLSSGVEGITLGTLALENRILLMKILEMYPDRITITLDFKDGKLRTHGWFTETGLSLTDTIQQMKDIGANRFNVTDITKAGALSGLNYSSFDQLGQFTNDTQIIVSGGISSIQDVEELYNRGMSGIMLFSSLFEGKVSLGDCQEYIQKGRNRVLYGDYFNQFALSGAIIQTEFS